jgi:hypothetical protein
MLQIKKNESNASRRYIPFRLVYASDHVTPNGNQDLTGKVTIYISKNGGIVSGGAGTVVTVGSITLTGLYYYIPTQAEVDSIGFVDITI